MKWIDIPMIVILVVVSLLLFYAIRSYILPKVKIKKIYVLSLMIIFIILPGFLGDLYAYPAVQYSLMLAVSLTMLIYIELVRMDKEKKNKPVIGRPKPKKLNIKNSDDKK